jgi:shikimate dehydrogenase
MKRACVIGWPIAHSRSPLIHNYWLRLHGIDGIYSREPVEPQALETFITGLQLAGFEGCNVTLPHKEAVFNLVTPADEATHRLRAVNTVFHREGKIYGTNTDGEGFMASLVSSVPDLRLAGTRVMLIGAGGAAMAIAGALLDARCAEIAVSNRTRERAEQLRKQFGSRICVTDWQARHDALADCALLVNTTALGMSGQPPLEINLTRLSRETIITDIVYTPLETPFLAEARRRGNPVVPGLGMLLYQAVRGFELWFGPRPKVTNELYRLVEADVSAGQRK